MGKHSGTRSYPKTCLFPFASFLHLCSAYRVVVNTQGEPPFHRLICLQECNVHNDASGHYTPLPSNSFVLKDFGIEERNVDDWKGDQETSHDRPEEKPIVVNCPEYRKWTGPTLIHGKQTFVKVLYLPGGD